MTVILENSLVGAFYNLFCLRAQYNLIEFFVNFFYTPYSF